MTSYTDPSYLPNTIVLLSYLHLLSHTLTKRPMITFRFSSESSHYTRSSAYKRLESFILYPALKVSLPFFPFPFSLLSLTSSMHTLNNHGDMTCLPYTTISSENIHIVRSQYLPYSSVVTLSYAFFKPIKTKYIH